MNFLRNQPLPIGHIVSFQKKRIQPSYNHFHHFIKKEEMRRSLLKKDKNKSYFTSRKLCEEDDLTEFQYIIIVLSLYGIFFW